MAILVDPENWHTLLCPRCFQPVISDNGISFCQHAACIINGRKVDSLPWYRVCVEVSDNEMYEVDFTLSCKIAEEIIGISAPELIKEINEDTEHVTSMLQKLVGRHFLFTVVMIQARSCCKTTNFQVVYVTDVPALHQAMESFLPTPKPQQWPKPIHPPGTRVSFPISSI